VVPAYKVVRRRAKGAKAKEVEPNGLSEATHDHRPYLHGLASQVPQWLSSSLPSIEEAMMGSSRAGGKRTDIEPMVSAS
jgi:hypothetical protein